MKQSGRANWMVVVGVIGIVLITIIALTSGDSPSMVATKFISGLAVGDIEAILKTSTIADETPEVQRKEWEQTLKRAQYYRFRWKLTTESPQTPTQSSVLVSVERNVAMSSYEENFQIPCRKIDGAWKVDVRGLSRSLYPFLPR